MALGKVLSLGALLFSVIKSWAWELGMDGKITSWASSGSNISIHNSWNILCMLALFVPLKEISENGKRGVFRENVRFTAEQGWPVKRGGI